MSHKPKIKAWKPIVKPISPEEMISKIESAINMIYAVSGSISFQEIYDCGFQLVQNNKGKIVYQKVTDMILKKTTELCDTELSEINFLQNIHSL